MRANSRPTAAAFFPRQIGGTSPAGRLLFPGPARFTDALRDPNAPLTGRPDAQAMKTPLLLLVTALSAVAAAVPVAATADPAGAVKADLTQLQSDITKAHDTLLSDIAKITADAGKGDPATIRADIQAFRSDRETLVGNCKTDIAQLKTDLQAAKAANPGSPELKALVQSVRDLAHQDRSDVQAAIQQARDAIKALKDSGGGAHAPTSTTPSK